MENEIRLLVESEDEQDIAMVNNDNQMVTILMTMLPDAAAGALLAKYEIGTDTF